jgi:hypothetical protein
MALGLVLGPVAASFAELVPGGGPTKSDCYIELDVTGATNVAKSKIVTCSEGDPTCDTDGAANNTCVFTVALCPNQTNVTGCTPAPPLTSISVKKATLTNPADLSGTTCGPTTDISVPLKVKKNGTKKPGKLVIHVKATSSGKPKKDVDNIKLICSPAPPAGGVCTKNPAGGPDQIDLSTIDSGTDLDNGWTGISHNFPTPQKSGLSLCLSTCDASTNPVCDANGPVGLGSVNGLVFGPPLPLIAQSVPVCVINRYNGDVTGKINIQTGEVLPDNPMAVNLLSDVHLTIPNQVCPKCKGSGAIGGTGTCDSGKNAGKSCRIDSILNVVQAEGDTNYQLSKDCPPDPGQIAGTLDIKLRLTTGTSTLTGSKPCTGSGGVAVQDDNCHGAPCNQPCSGTACAKMVTDPVSGAQVCQDAKGGLSQLCCANSTSSPCFPSSAASGAAITRMGHPDPPAPVWPDATYPKTSDHGVLVTTFCEGATTASTINATAGLPGPGALILPGTQMLKKLP